MLKEEYPVRLLCQILDCAPSSYYYRSTKEDDLLLREEIERIAMEFPRYGYRRMTAELRRRGYAVNHKRALRIMREENLLVQVRGYLKTTLSNHHLGKYPNLIKDIQIVRPNQVWCGDITYIPLKREYAYSAVLMDVFTRSIRGWEISGSLDEQLTSICGEADKDVEGGSIQDARRRIGYFLEVVYMHKRVLSALGYLTPKEFEQRWRKRANEVERDGQV